MFIYGISCHEQKHFLHIQTNVKHKQCERNQHLLKSYVMELLYRKDYSTERRPKLLTLGSLFMEELSITKPSESQMIMIVEKEMVQIIIIHHRSISL